MFLHFFHRLPKKSIPQSQAGFGLIELLVSISIMVIIMAVILIRQTSFNGAVLLRSQAYEIALQLRDVQLNAVSATNQGGAFRSTVGIYFNENAPANTTYRIFRDGDEPIDGYDGTAEEFGLQGLMDPRFEIREIITTGDTYNASDGLSIMFQRPNFDAIFYDSSGQVNASLVEIVIGLKNVTPGSDTDVTRIIEISPAGQIAVQNTTP